NPESLEEKMDKFAYTHYPEDIEVLEKHQQENGEPAVTFKLINLPKLHVSKQLNQGTSESMIMIYTLIALGLFIMLIACFNFVNLSIANSFHKIKELGIRKTIGAQQGQLLTQVWVESLLICMVSFGVGYVLSIIALPPF